jgi:glycosyltransferase involved in cell wall biosynthesis
MGGMAESVRHEVDGLTFRPADAAALADTMERALTEPQLWERLVEGIPPRRTLEACAADHLALYRNLLADERSNAGRATRAKFKAGDGKSSKLEGMTTHVS